MYHITQELTPLIIFMIILNFKAAYNYEFYELKKRKTPKNLFTNEDM